jgi:hypothetical protein
MDIGLIVPGRDSQATAWAIFTRVASAARESSSGREPTRTATAIEFGRASAEDCRAAVRAEAKRPFPAGVRDCGRTPCTVR